MNPINIYHIIKIVNGYLFTKDTGEILSSIIDTVDQINLQNENEFTQTEILYENEFTQTEILCENKYTQTDKFSIINFIFCK